jgi:predicted aconitase
VDSLDPAYQIMDADPDLRQIDLVTIGCPHASLSEIQQIAAMLQGQRLATQLWVTTARITRERAREAGWVQVIEAAGGQVVADTCAVVAPVRSIGITSMATNAGKMACYAPAHSKVKMRYGSLAQCVDAALTGRWNG